jgi:hypothetical protein
MLDYSSRNTQPDYAFPCPGCRQPMKMVGKERDPDAPHVHLLTFQCQCGQLLATRANQ